MTIEEALLILETPRAAELPDLLNEMGEHLRRQRDLARLQVDSALADVSLRNGICSVYPRRLLLFETRMLGLLSPVLVLASTRLDLHPPDQDGSIRVVALFVGTPVPSAGEVRLKKRLLTALGRREVALRLLSARNAQSIRKAVQAIDKSYPDIALREKA